MLKTTVYDLPTRMFHWLFSSLFISAILIAKYVDDESPLYFYHMLAGILLGCLVILRIFWGLVGTRYARFSSFALHPKELLRYAKEFLGKSASLHPGHNPASSWASLIMLTAGLFLALSGVLMTSGFKEELEDIHEILSDVFLVTAVAHVLGVLLHTLRHKDAIALSMVHGKKAQLDPRFSIPSTAPKAALALGLLVCLLTATILFHYDSSTRQLTLLGQTLELAE